MTISVHHTHITDYDLADYEIVGHSYEGQRVKLASRERTCLHPMRSWSAPNGTANYGFCLMDAGHKGRHATVVFHCDICDKARRGEPAARDLDINGDTNAVFCWFCLNVEPPRPVYDSFLRQDVY